jgi:hypothetical protein
MSQGVEILNDGPFSTTLDTLLYNDPQFQVFGRETTPIQLRSRLRDYHESEDLIHASVGHWQ